MWEFGCLCFILHRVFVHGLCVCLVCYDFMGFVDRNRFVVGIY